MQQRFPGVFVICAWVAISLFVLTTFAGEIKAQIELSSEEIAWIKAHPVIRHAPDNDYAPFEFKDNSNRHIGLAPDMLKLISKKLGVQFQVVHAPNWAATLENIKQHRADFAAAAITPDRSEYMLFTSPFIEYNNIILVPEHVTGYFILKDFEGKTLAAIKGWAMTEFIQKKYPKIRLLWAKDIKSALEAVSDGTADAYLINRFAAGYWMAKTGITNLRIAGETDYTYKLSLGSRKDWPMLNRLFEKALKSISRSEREEIFNKWTFSQERGWRPGSQVWIWISLGVIVVLLLIIGIFVWDLTVRRRAQAKPLLTKKV
jgi:ABC-type amino acid transport substrate-binding protein